MYLGLLTEAKELNSKKENHSKMQNAMRWLKTIKQENVFENIDNYWKHDKSFEK